MSTDPETNPDAPKFDFSAFPPDSCFHDRRTNPDDAEAPKPAPRPRKERRRRVDPTTFEKQYSEEELEFMNAMQRFKVQSGRTFPNYGEVLDVAYALGYRKPSDDEAGLDDAEAPDDLDLPPSIRMPTEV
jgi:hypothetical protein